MPLDSPRKKPAKKGRPRVYGAAITVSVTPSTLRHLRTSARTDGVSVPQLIAELVARDIMLRDRVIALHVIDRHAYDAIRERVGLFTATRAAGGRP